MRTIEYTIVSGNRLDGVIAKIQMYLDDGWLLNGDLIQSGDMYTRELVRTFTVAEIKEALQEKFPERLV